MTAPGKRPSRPQEQFVSDRPKTDANGSSPICKSARVLAPEDFCGQPATVPVTVACVHEHVRDSHACPEHAVELASHHCGPCYAADGHKCLLSVLAVAS